LISILAGREFLNAFFFDRSTGRSWQGEATFALSALFFLVVTVFYLIAPPAAAEVYNWFGQRAIDSGNAAEAELYLESATRLDPDPHAANLLEVGCLYLTLGAPDRAENVFERVLEADSRLLLARFYLAEIYSDQAEYDKALQLIADGLNLLDNARGDLGQDGFLSAHIDDEITADQVEYLLRLAFGRAYLETNTLQQAKENLARADQILRSLASQGILSNAAGTVELPCAPDERLGVYISSTQLDLRYLQARTFDSICATDQDDQAAKEAWNFVARSRSSNSRQEARIAEAKDRLSNVSNCTQLKSGTQARDEETPFTSG
jgi:tetratricopeptide (TPR) repeat protein